MPMTLKPAAHAAGRLLLVPLVLIAFIGWCCVQAAKRDAGGDNVGSMD